MPAFSASTIPFTQYVAPHGRKREVSIEMPADLVGLACRFIEAGGRYEAEVLTATGEVSLTAHLVVDGEPQDVAIEVVPNGPGMKEAVERLVRASLKHVGGCA